MIIILVSFEERSYQIQKPKIAFKKEAQEAVWNTFRERQIHLWYLWTWKHVTGQQVASSVDVDMWDTMMYENNDKVSQAGTVKYVYSLAKGGKLVQH